MVASASSSNTQCPSGCCRSTSAFVARAIAASSAGSLGACEERDGMVSVLISFRDPVDQFTSSARAFSHLPWRGQGHRIWLRAGRNLVPPLEKVGCAHLSRLSHKQREQIPSP